MWAYLVGGAYPEGVRLRFLGVGEVGWVEGGRLRGVEVDVEVSGEDVCLGVFELSGGAAGDGVGMLSFWRRLLVVLRVGEGVEVSSCMYC